MKVLFIVQGEGRGHLTQAIAASRMLREAGHEVVEVLIGRSPSRQIPAFFYEQIGAPVESFTSPNFLPAPHGQRPRLVSSVFYNVARLPIYAKSMYWIYCRSDL